MKPITLLINGSDCSDEAVDLLHANNIPFQSYASAAPEVPCADYNGNLFCGIREIRLLVHGLSEVRK